jgi:hypothetical protein
MYLVLKSRSSVIKNRKSFHLVRVFSIQWRLINFWMHRSDDCRSWNFITNVNRWAHVSFWFWKKLNFDNSKCFHRKGFEMYTLIIIYTVCTCDTLVPTRILNSEISWFCFDFPKWGPCHWAHVSFWFWKKLNFLHFLPCKEIISCMFYLKDYQLQWILFWLNQFIR